MEGMTMTKEEKKAYVALSRRRYSELKSKKEKGEFLDGFCPVMGIDRKNAIRLLSPREKPHRRRGRPFATGMDARKLLVAIWKKAGRPCSRLLAPVLGLWIESLRRHGEEIPDDLAAEVTGMSASTIDRRLHASRPRIGGGRRPSSLAEHRREIPLKVDTWPTDAVAYAGWIEIDSVAHCGGSMAGSFCWSLTVTDTATQWTEMRITWNNGAEGVVARLREVAASLPFAVHGVNTDNGPEFLNWHLNGCFKGLFPGAKRTRSRPYNKNDNAHVEQKNGHRVRRLFGFGRFDVREAVGAMNELARLVSLNDNLYRATQKMLSKTREGHHYRKVFEKEAKTPAQRILEDKTVPRKHRDHVKALLAENDPLDLSRRIDRALLEMWRIIRKAREDAAATAGGGLALRAAPSGPPPPAVAAAKTRGTECAKSKEVVR